MPSYTDVMVDLETTATQPDRGAILQIAAVKFNLQTREVSPDFYNQCLSIPPNRTWSEDTREWWLEQKPELLTSIYRRMRDPRTVMLEFVEWAQGPKVFWCKPLSFDYPFVSSYLRDFEIGNPFPFYAARDLHSFITGRAPTFNEKSVSFDGDAHDALADALHQLRILYAALDHKDVALIEG